MFFGDIRPAWSHRYRLEARLTSGLVATCGSCTVGEFVEFATRLPAINKRCFAHNRGRRHGFWGS